MPRITPLSKPVRRVVLFGGTWWVVTITDRGVEFRCKGQRRRWIVTWARALAEYGTILSPGRNVPGGKDA